MSLHDLTPQLRTRLSRMERAVGWFVLLAAALLVSGFVYYVYNTAERKGWFKGKAPYFTFTDRATGLKKGDPVKLMGLDVGQITDIKPMAPEFPYNMYIQFEIQEPFYGYLWTIGSKAKVATADLLGKRELEVTKGTAGYPAYVFKPFRTIAVAEARTLPDWEQWQFGEDIYDATETNLVVHALWPLSTNLSTVAALGRKQIRVLDTRESQRKKFMTAVWNDRDGWYEAYSEKTHKPYWLKSDESAAITERLEQLVEQVEKALPNILGLTNQLATVLSNSASLTSNLNVVAIGAQPAVSNLTAATAQLDRPGALGEWLFSTNVNRQLESALGNADAVLANANTNLTALAENLDRSLTSLADLTSNLNHQVQINTNILSQVSQVIVDTDDLVQGLKRHWLLRSAFKSKSTNAPAAKTVEPIRSPKGKE